MRKGNEGEGKARKHSIMLPDAFIEEMKQVRELIGAQSDSEVIRRAFTLYKRLLEIEAAGGKISVDESGGQNRIIIT